MTIDADPNERKRLRIPLQLGTHVVVDAEMYSSIRGVRLCPAANVGQGSLRLSMLLVAFYKMLVDLGERGVKHVDIVLEDYVRSDVKQAVRAGDDGTERCLDYAIVCPLVLHLVEAARQFHTLPHEVQLRQDPEAEIGGAAIAKQSPEAVILSGDGDVIAEEGLEAGAWVEYLGSDGCAMGPMSTIDFVTAETAHRLAYVLGSLDEAANFVEWAGGDAPLMLMLSRAFSGGCDYLRPGLTHERFGRRSPALLAALVKAYRKARPSLSAPELGRVGFLKNVALQVFQELCTMRKDILVTRDDAPHSYVYGAFVAVVTLAAAPRRRFVGEDPEVACYVTRLTCAEYAEVAACFASVVQGLPRTLGDVFEIALRRGVSLDPANWTNEDVVYVLDGRVHVLDLRSPPVPAWAARFVGECEGLIKRVAAGEAPLGLLRAVSGDLAAACRLLETPTPSLEQGLFGEQDADEAAAAQAVAACVEINQCQVLR
jgi:hypothetical protein